MKSDERLYTEKSIIKTILDSEYAFIELISFGIDRDLFLNKDCQLVFDLITAYFEKYKKKPQGLIPLYEFAAANDEINKNFLQELITHETDNHYMDVAKKLLDDNCKKAIQKLVQESSKSNCPGIDLAFELNDKISSFITQYYKKYNQETGFRNTAETVITNIKNIMEGKTSDYIPSGFKDLDKKILGFHKKSITVIAARPGMGKTAFLLQLRRNLLQKGFKPAVISLEMDKESLLVRDLSAETKINSMDIESGKLTPEQFTKIQDGLDNCFSEDFLIDDSSNHTVKTAMNTINRWKIQNNVDIVFIDYLTLMKSATPDKYGRFDLEIGKMTEALRIFSKDTETPIVILSQLNREVEKRMDKMPQLADLRESGSIEQDARLVMFLFRPFAYGIDYTKEENHKDYYTDQQQLVDPSEYLEVIVAKNRGGLTGRIPLQYQREIHTFKNLYSLQEII